MDTSLDLGWTPITPPPQCHQRPDEYSPVYPDRLIRPLPKRLLRTRLQKENDLESSQTSFFHRPSPLNSAVKDHLGSLKFHSPTTPKVSGLQGQGPLSAFQSPINFDFGKTWPNTGQNGGFGGNDGVRVASLSSPLAFRPHTQTETSFPKSVTFGSNSLLVGVFDSLDNPSIKKRKVPVFGLASGFGPLESDAIGTSPESPDTSDGSDLDQTIVSEPFPVFQGSGSRHHTRPFNPHKGWKLAVNKASQRLNRKGNRRSSNLANSAFLRMSLLPSTSSSSLSSNDAFPDSVRLSRYDKREPSFPVRSSEFTFTYPSRLGVGSWPGSLSGSELHSDPHADRVYYSKQTSRNTDMAESTMEEIARKPKRSISRYYLSAERQRKLKQGHQNSLKPPTKDEIWICEFCEYESIFGTRPEALIRQYEAKALVRRRRLADQQRQLEQAKNRGRRNKKNRRRKAGGQAPAVQEGAALVDGTKQLGTEGGDGNGEEDEEVIDERQERDGGEGGGGEVDKELDSCNCPSPCEHRNPGGGGNIAEETDSPPGPNHSPDTGESNKYSEGEGEPSPGG